MAAYVKFKIFVRDLANKIHDIFGSSAADLLKVALTNTTPNDSADTIFGDITEISAGNGYTAGGEDIQNSGSWAAGTFTLQGTKVVWTCVTAPMATFRYVVLYNDTPTSPADPLIAYWDYGSALTLQVGETFSVKFNNQEGAGNIATLA